jgi:hypothetical protein
LLSLHSVLCGQAVELDRAVAEVAAARKLAVRLSWMLRNAKAQESAAHNAGRVFEQESWPHHVAVSMAGGEDSTGSDPERNARCATVSKPPGSPELLTAVLRTSPA